MDLIEGIVLSNIVLTFILFLVVSYIIIRLSIAISLMKAFKEQEASLRNALVTKKDEPFIMTPGGPMPISEFKDEASKPTKKDNAMFG